MTSRSRRSKPKGWFHWVGSTMLGLWRSPVEVPTREILPVPLTEEQTRLVALVQAAARAQVRCSATLEEFKQTMYGCSLVSEVINMRDASGYNLLQTAIMVDRADIVEYLIFQGADVNSPVCGRALHLAASLGRTAVLSVLLRFGADPHVTSAVCYPDPHRSDHLLYNPTTRQWGSTCRHDIDAGCNHETRPSGSRGSKAKPVDDREYYNFPLYYAIKRDNVDCVKLLEAHFADNLLPGERCLHTAAHFGSRKCVEYFILSQRQTIVTLDGHGRSSLHRGLHHGKEMVQLLVKNGASLTCKSNHEESLLHLVFAEDVHVGIMEELCRYLLDCGLKMTINTLDKDGNSPLHNCLRRVHQSAPRTRTDWKDLENCLLLLLENNANPNISNREGNTPLHVLLDIIHFKEKDFAVVLSEFEMRAEAVERLLRLLLLHNANPSIANKMSNTSAPTNITGVIPLDTPLLMFIHNLFFKGYSGWIYHAAKTLDREHRLPFLARFRDMCCNVISILGQSTGSIQQPLRTCPIKLLVRYLEYIDVYGQKMVTDETSVAQNYLEALLAYLRAMLAAGFKPKDDNEWILVLETFCVLYEHKLVSYAILRDFLLVLLQYGTETNRCEYTMYNGVPAPDVESFPLVALLAPNSKSNYTQDERLELIAIFLNSMDRSTVRQCIAYIRPRRSVHSDSVTIDLVKDQLCKPLRLKALCAHTVRYSLKKNLAPNVKYLPLPTEIQKYLLQLQY